MRRKLLLERLARYTSAPKVPCPKCGAQGLWALAVADDEVSCVHCGNAVYATPPLPWASAAERSLRNIDGKVR